MINKFQAAYNAILSCLSYDDEEDHDGDRYLWHAMKGDHGKAVCEALLVMIGRRTPVTVPHGYKLVPIFPTNEMIEAGEKFEHFEGGYGSTCREFWDAMIAAVPLHTTLDDTTKL